MDDLIILLLLAIVTALFLSHRAIHEAQFDKASLLRLLTSGVRFDTYSLNSIVNNDEQDVAMMQATEGYSLAANSPLISRALGRAVELLLADFVEPWYRRISSNEDFPNDIRSMCDHMFNVFASRARRVDWTMFVVRHVINHLIFLVKIYRLTERHLLKTNPFFANPHTPEHVKHKLLYAEIVQTYRLHPGIIDSDGYLRKVSEALLSRLLPPADFRCAASRDLLREMMLQYCLKVGMSFCQPHWINVQLVNALRKVKIEQATASDPATQAALERASRELKSATAAQAKKDKKEKKEKEKKDEKEAKELKSKGYLAYRAVTGSAKSSTSYTQVASPMNGSTPAPIVNGSATAPIMSPPMSAISPEQNSPAGASSQPTTPMTPSRSINGSHSSTPGHSRSQTMLGLSTASTVDGSVVSDTDLSSRNISEPHTANAQDEAVRKADAKEDLLNQKMQLWHEEREKRERQQQQQQQYPSLAASHSFDSLNDFHDKSSSNRPPTHAASARSSIIQTSAEGYSKRAAKGMFSLPPVFNPNFSAVPMSAITSNWEARIGSAGIRFDPKPYAAYQLDVKNGSTVSLLSWTLEKRYNQFEELHSKLKRSMPPSFDAQLPKKHFFGNLDMEFIRQRKKELEKYLSQLLWNQHVQKSEELKEFLMPSEKDLREATKKMSSTTSSLPPAPVHPVAPIPAGTPPFTSHPTPQLLPQNSSPSLLGSAASPTLSPAASFNSQSSAPSSPALSTVSHTVSSPSFVPVVSAPSLTRTRSVTTDDHSAHHASSHSLSQSGDLARPGTASGPRPSLVQSQSHDASHEHADAASLDVMRASTPDFPTLSPTVSAPAAALQHSHSHNVFPDHSNVSSTSTPAVNGLNTNHFATLSTPRLAPSAPDRAPAAAPSTPSKAPVHPRGTPASTISTTRPRKGSRAGASSRSTRKTLEREVGENLYHLLEQVFDLNHSFVRRTVASTLKQSIKLIFKESINARVKDAITAAVSEKSVITNIEWMTDLVWPGGVFKGAAAPVSDTVKSNTSQQAASLMLESVPTLLTTVLGTQHCDQAILRFFQFLQMEPLVQHLAYTVLDTFIVTLFPELKQYVHVNAATG